MWKFKRSVAALFLASQIGALGMMVQPVFADSHPYTDLVQPAVSERMVGAIDSEWANDRQTYTINSSNANQWAGSFESCHFSTSTGPQGTGDGTRTTVEIMLTNPNSESIKIGIQEGVYGYADDWYWEFPNQRWRNKVESHSSLMYTTIPPHKTVVKRVITNTDQGALSGHVQSVYTVENANDDSHVLAYSVKFHRIAS
ncbi:MAG: hypothetical protein LBT80_00210 [Lactobacillaceae bacterium]|jgi:hypothetical protein|nr:hypothetical protein [Lactobacillaceae bacterium]